MMIEKLALPGVCVIAPDYYPDHRGYSTESYNDRTLREHGIFTRFVMDYECGNTLSGTIRGIHCQNNPYAQAKLVRVLQGAVWDVVVDLRRDSPTYKKWLGLELSAESGKQIYIPSGYGHAYVTKRPDTVVLYKFSSYYSPEFGRSIRWNDPEIGIDWGVEEPVLSQKDKDAPLLKDCDLNLTWRENG